ncbi:hypothetical protein JX266_011102 [Neoarthrinium moseri]|nr:hypothetical protein JX266_011102 [Neoarthrinium moseri]
MAEYQKYHEALRNYFTKDSIFTLEGIIGHGEYGLASKVSYKNPVSGEYRKFIVKQTYRNEDLDTLAAERHWLQQLAHAPHIVSMVSIPNNPLITPPERGTPPNEGASSGNRRQNRDPPIEQRTILLEWIAHGELGDFLKRAARHPKPIPNRLLWRFFGCFLRMVVAMAYPPSPPPAGQATQSEEIIYDTNGQVATPSMLRHTDMHDGNILLSDPPSDVEHDFAPMLKLIDFGLAEDTLPNILESPDPNPQFGVHCNMFDAGILMCCLILKYEWSRYPGHGDLLSTIEIPGSGPPPVKTYAQPLYALQFQSDPCPNVDPDIKRLVSICMAVKPTDRPKIEVVLGQVMDYIQKRDAAYYNNAAEEKDDYIRNLWTTALFNPPSPASSEDSNQT